MSQLPLPRPLFDTSEHQAESQAATRDYLSGLTLPGILEEYRICEEFLKSYQHSADTYTAYRRETERLLHWAWLICQKPLKTIDRNDIRDYLDFVNHPPAQWISLKAADRFIDHLGTRIPNTTWRPFTLRLTKMQQRMGKSQDKSEYQLSNKSIQAIFAALSSLFTFMQQEDYLSQNPISLIRQKKGFLQAQQTRKVTRKLSRLQWYQVILTAEQLANHDPQHERTLFLMSAFYLLGLRISELAYIPGRLATMGSFAPDKNGLWWFTTIGKGNKMRDIAVPDELLEALKRYRLSLGLSSLPSREETTPLLPKQRGKQGLGARQIRNIVQVVFNHAISALQEQGKTDEAEDLATATVHWLRHTAISADVEFRPREHIRDDVGHESPSTMDKYIDIDRVARHHSAQGKKLKPDVPKSS